MEKYLEIGVVTSPHGVRGEVKVFPTTDDAGRFRLLDEVLLREGGDGLVSHKVENVKFFKNMVILKLSGVDSMDEAEKIRGREILIPREEGVPLEENEYYFADMIGMKVFSEEGELLGELRDILQTGANDVYVVQSEQHGEVLIPAIKDCIISVNTEEGTMTVHLLPGLI